MAKKFRFNQRKAKKRIERHTWKKAREEVLKRDKGCAICDDARRTKGINVHHILPRNYLLLRYSQLNLIGLCSKHHKYSYELSAHKNPVMFIFWLTINRKEQFNRLMELYLEQTK